jgi:glycosyltransferase 2 family protein
MARSQRTDWRWTWAKRALALAIIGLAVFLLYNTLSGYSIEQIIRSIARIPTERLLLAGLFAGASYFCLTWFDFLALHYAGKPLAYRRAALASFCALSLGHNIGFAALSSGAIRLRFYARWGLRMGDVAKVILFCGLTVGLGLVTLGGFALLLRPDLGGRITGLGRPLIMLIGFACLSVPVVYATLAAFLRRPLRIRGWTLSMPDLKLALAQIAVGSLNFALVAACLYQTLAALADVSYIAVAAVYVIANITALMTHVPGGLGVIEGMVIFLVPAGGIIGALLMFRVIYFLLPLCIGAPLFGIAELYYRRRKKTA